MTVNYPERKTSKSGKDIIFAANLIKNGKLVALPTETVYGLGADCFDANAVAQIFALKKRPFFDPLILHVAKIDDLEIVFKKPILPIIYKLAEKYWPGPLTIVAPKNPKVPDIVTAGLPTVAVRMPNNQLALKLITKAGVPIAAPSANLFGRLSPTNEEHVKEQLQSVDYIIEGGQTSVGIESTIIAVSEAGVEVLRPGAITVEQIVADFPKIKIITKKSEPDDVIQSPGQSKNHYAPVKPFYLIDAIPDELPEYVGLLLFKPTKLPEGVKAQVKVLSESGNPIEVAANMFSVLHEMERNPQIEKIYSLKVEETGIGIAIMDRLKKAANRYSSLASFHEANGAVSEVENEVSEIAG